MGWAVWEQPAVAGASQRCSIFFSSRRRHTRYWRDWSSDVCSSDLVAVYTEVTDEELSAFIATYDIGTVLSFKGIAEGVENTNYFLHTSTGSYIVTLYEKDRKSVV